MCPAKRWWNMPPFGQTLLVETTYWTLVLVKPHKMEKQLDRVDSQGRFKFIEYSDNSWNIYSLAILCDLFGMVKWPFQGLSDLKPRDKKVTLNHLEFFAFSPPVFLVEQGSLSFKKHNSVPHPPRLMFSSIEFEAKISCFHSFVTNQHRNSTKKEHMFLDCFL